MIGFIGTGNMTKAIISGVISSGLYDNSKIFGSAKSKETIEYMTETYKINMVPNIDVVKNSKVIFLGVKPYQYETVLNEIKDYIEDKIIVSIAPLKYIDFLRKTVGRDIKCVSSVPNTPALVCSGMSAVSFSDNLLNDDKKLILDLFSSFGEVEVIDESLMNAVIGVSGSSPAYVYMFIEALADGAVKHGMSRKLAYKFASQAVLGSAKMVLETGIHPAELKDNVCSPGGTTIEAVESLKQNAFQGIVMEAMDKCIGKVSK